MHNGVDHHNLIMFTYIGRWIQQLYICHSCENWGMKFNLTGHARRDRVSQGCLCMCRWVSMTLLCMHQEFPTKRKKPDNRDVIRGEYKRGLTQIPAFSFIWSVLVRFLTREATDPLFQISWCLAWCRTVKYTGKCLFVYLIHMCPRLTWSP